jgi:pyruvate kinase
MIRIAETAEASLDVDAHYNRDFTGEETVTNIIGYASCSTAESLHAKAIITPTSSGYTARMISKFRPHARIVAVMNKPYVHAAFADVGRGKHSV